MAGVQSSPTFNQQLSVGKVGESVIKQWLNSIGFSVLPVYEKMDSEYKGPQLFTPTGGQIAPDMFVFRGEKCMWIEAKHKSAFSWHRITGRWVTGIDLRHYLDYCKIDDDSPFPVWLLFLQRSGQAVDSPPNCPTGLFGNPLKYLRMHENHRHANHGKSGMVYWSVAHLQKIASLEVVLSATQTKEKS